MSSKSVLRLLGLAAVGGTGYYFYVAGGSAQGAKERAEADLHRASADIKAHLPHREETDAKGTGAKAGEKFDSAVCCLSQMALRQYQALVSLTGHLGCRGQ